MAASCNCLAIRTPVVEGMFENGTCTGVSNNGTCAPTCKPGFKLYGEWHCVNGTFDLTRPVSCVEEAKKVVKREGLKSEIAFTVPAMNTEEKVVFKEAVAKATKKSVA